MKSTTYNSPSAGWIIYWWGNCLSNAPSVCGTRVWVKPTDLPIFTCTRALLSYWSGGLLFCVTPIFRFDSILNIYDYHLHSLYMIWNVHLILANLLIEIVFKWVGIDDDVAKPSDAIVVRRGDWRVGGRGLPAPLHVLQRPQPLARFHEQAVITKVQPLAHRSSCHPLLRHLSNRHWKLLSSWSSKLFNHKNVDSFSRGNITCWWIVTKSQILCCNLDRFVASADDISSNSRLRTKFFFV